MAGRGRAPLIVVLVGLAVAVGSGQAALYRERVHNRDRIEDVAELTQQIGELAVRVCEGRKDDRAAIVGLVRRLVTDPEVVEIVADGLATIDCDTTGAGP